MSYTDSSVSFSNPRVQDFLFNEDHPATTFELTPQEKPGYTHDIHDRRAPANDATYTKAIKYLVKEVWRLEKENSEVGDNAAIVVYERDIEISVSFWLYLSTAPTVTAQHKADLRALFNSYDPPDASRGDIHSWIRDHLVAPLDETMVMVEAVLTLTRTGARREVNIDQRKALREAYGDQTDLPDPKPFGRIGGETSEETIATWAGAYNVRLRMIGEELIREPAPPITTDVREIPPVDLRDTSPVVTDVLNAVLARIIPGTCGPLHKEVFRILTLSFWPEFMIAWDTQRIRVGCADVTISLPRLLTRTATIVFFAFFTLPDNALKTMLGIAETCAKRAALAGTVIGVITGNAPAAIAAFKSLFQNCCVAEIKGCLNPGIFTIKEVGPWA